MSIEFRHIDNYISITPVWALILYAFPFFWCINTLTFFDHLLSFFKRYYSFSVSFQGIFFFFLIISNFILFFLLFFSSLMIPLSVLSCYLFHQIHMFFFTESGFVKYSKKVSLGNGNLCFCIILKSSTVKLLFASMINFCTSPLGPGNANLSTCSKYGII